MTARGQTRTSSLGAARPLPPSADTLLRSIVDLQRDEIFDGIMGCLRRLARTHVFLSLDERFLLPSNAVTWLIRSTKAGPTGRAKRCGITQQDLELLLARVLDLLPVGESTKIFRG